MFRPLWIEIDLRALRKNFKIIKDIVGERTKIIATVKQFAYGHGLVPVARELSAMGVAYFGLGSIEEGIILRSAGFKERMLVLTAVLPQFAEYFLRYNITPAIVDIDFARKINAVAKKKGIVFPVHVKIDTGMGRLGPYYKDAYRFVRELSAFKHIALEGVFTHFPNADADTEFTIYQISVFNDFIATLKKEGISFQHQHCANSIGIMCYPYSHFTMVRPGLMLYGIRPSPDIDFTLQPVLSLKSKIVFIKKITKGMTVSYGRTYVAKKSSLVATVAIGYADGYPWSLSNRAKVIIKDSFFNVVGRVCMDHVMVNLGNREDIKVGEEVILIGKKNTLQISAEEISLWAKTIPYEIVSRLSLRIPRTYKYARSGRG
ncbi:MAG: alanine racemase [Candidatus Omnitrophota bacterium]